MKSKFVALATAGKEAEWLRNLIIEIPLWSKPIAPRSIICDSAATLAKVYRQMYNGKSRHLGVRHSMIRELITNGVYSVFQNSMAEVSVSVSVVDEGTVEFVSQLPKVRLLRLLVTKVCVDARKVGEYRRMSRELRERQGSVRNLSACISELRALGDCGDGYETVRLFERLRLENMEKDICLRMMLKETQLKITEKGKFIMKLRGGGVVEVCQDRIPSVSEFEWQLVDLEKKAKERALQIQWQSLYVCYVKDLVLTMAWLPICGELRSSSYSVHWEPMFILYCQRSISEDYRLASEINRVVGEVNNVVITKDQFLKELDRLGVRPVPAKLAEFLREIQMRDKETVAKLQILEKEMELNTRKKDLFIQKLKGLIPY
ncbi:hypothetical protein Tco_1092713 [Tanacetum coccineum]|uniref:Zinc finger, CCHC-type n=1 Tax=Tanacetum coccineum TaxID=301880 RepID=A0ABQ5IAZ2_9ASTR